MTLLWHTKLSIKIVLNGNSGVRQNKDLLGIITLMLICNKLFCELLN